MNIQRLQCAILRSNRIILHPCQRECFCGDEGYTNQNIPLSIIFANFAWQSVYPNVCDMKHIFIRVSASVEPRATLTIVLALLPPLLSLPCRLVLVLVLLLVLMLISTPNRPQGLSYITSGLGRRADGDHPRAVSGYCWSLLVFSTWSFIKTHADFIVLMK